LRKKKKSGDWGGKTLITALSTSSLGFVARNRGGKPTKKGPKTTRGFRSTHVKNPHRVSSPENTTWKTFQEEGRGLLKVGSQAEGNWKGGTYRLPYSIQFGPPGLNYWKKKEKRKYRRNEDSPEHLLALSQKKAKNFKRGFGGKKPTGKKIQGMGLVLRLAATFSMRRDSKMKKIKGRVYRRRKI